MVFALAALFDPDAHPNSAEAREYFLLARLCLRFASPQQDTTLWAIQSIVRFLHLLASRLRAHPPSQIYMVQFMELSDREPAHTISHGAWILIGFAVKLGHSVSL